MGLGITELPLLDIFYSLLVSVTLFWLKERKISSNQYRKMSPLDFLTTVLEGERCSHASLQPNA